MPADIVITIPEYYTGKNVLITGATGFMGKVDKNEQAFWILSVFVCVVLIEATLLKHIIWIYRPGRQEVIVCFLCQISRFAHYWRFCWKSFWGPAQESEKFMCWSGQKPDRTLRPASLIWLTARWVGGFVFKHLHISWAFAPRGFGAWNSKKAGSPSCLDSVFWAIPKAH